MVIYMKKKMLILGLLTIVLFVLGAAPVMADTAPDAAPIKFTDEQIKLAQLNWNAYLQTAKPGQIVSVYPDSVIGQAAIINHFGPKIPAASGTQVASNPYFNYYQYYWCTYQYR